MPIFNDTFRTAAFLVSEASGYRSRDEVAIVTADAAWPSGTVLAIVGGDYKRYDGGAVSPGNVAVGILYEAIASGETAKRTIINRDAEVELAHLTTTNATGLAASLLLLGIKVR